MRKSFLFYLTLLILTFQIRAQVTNSSLSGTLTSEKETVIGATVLAIHEPTGTRYGAISNSDGTFTIQGMKSGGPYKIEISYLGYQTETISDIHLNLGENLVINADMKKSSETLKEVLVTATTTNNMKSDRAGSVINVSKMEMSKVPTITRSMNDIMKLSPQSSSTTNGFAVGGGNYRQSFVTVDGSAFNNAFGIGANLPANGSPISLDALEQVSVSVTPFDVRQSGFTGGAINAVTRSGENNFKGTAYTYLNNESMKGDKVADNAALVKNKSQNYTYGVSLGGPIIKNKLFYFVNAEYENNVTAGPSFRLRNDTSVKYGTNSIIRPLKSDIATMSDYLNTKYKYNPGRSEDYSIKTPTYRILARIDWNINDNHKLNFRFSRTTTKESSAPSSSVSPLTASNIYPGNTALGIASGNGRSTNYSMYYESQRYYQERNFTSISSELTSKFFGGKLNNLLRVSYSFQDEPRSFDGDAFTSVDILKDGALYASFGQDIFTTNNTREVKTYVVTDEVNFNIKNHNFIGGLQFESNEAKNGYMQAGNGYYIYNSWDDFVNNKTPRAFAITHSNTSDFSNYKAEIKYLQYSAYLQDNINLTKNLKVTAGIRFELPIYPSLDNNYNAAFAAMDFGGKKYSTDQLPKSSLSFSPRVGFNWDITGERKYVVRGGTGVFVGRLPFVWLVSAMSNSGVGQITTYYEPNNTSSTLTTTGIPTFYTNKTDILKALYPSGYSAKNPVAPSSPTIIDEDLKMPSTWKTSLAFDAKLPYDINLTVEAIYNKDYNPAVISNPGVKENGTITLAENDVRTAYSLYTQSTNSNKTQNVYLIENGKDGAYYYSLSAQLKKSFKFGLDLSAAYTHSYSRSYGDGIGDQVTSAYKTNTSAINGMNGHELGYGTYVAPDRIIASVGYRIEYAKNFASYFSFIYEGSQIGYVGTYSYSRYSYTFASNVVGDGGANNLLYIPATKEELNKWVFRDATGYTGQQQKDDFWNYINQDDYLKERKGKYVERGGATMPWHHQIDFKFNQDFYVNIAGKKNTIQVGVDIQNLPNLLNSNWGLYKQVYSSSILSYGTTKTDATKKYSFNKVDGNVLSSTYKDFNSLSSTYSFQISLRYIFN